MSDGPMNSDPKLKTVLFNTLSNSTDGLSTNPPTRISRVTFKSNTNSPGPRPALRGKFPPCPIGGTLKSTVGRQLETSSRLRSTPPSEMLNGAPDAALQIGDNI